VREPGPPYHNRFAKLETDLAVLIGMAAVQRSPAKSSERLRSALVRPGLPLVTRTRCDRPDRVVALDSPDVSFRHIPAWRGAERLPKHGHEAWYAFVTEVGGNLLN
jgi:hypothetical protein